MPIVRSPEPILPIELIALDIDGTLIGEDLEIGPRTRAAVALARRRGVIVSLVTGRMVSSALRYARVLELDAPIVGYQGAIIRDMPVAGSARIGKLLVHTPLRAETARDVIAWTRSVGLDPHLNHLERFIVRTDDPRADDYSAFMGWDADVADDLLSTIRHGVSKVMAAGEPPLPTEVLAAARERFAGRADVTVSHPRFLEFLAPGVSKGRAVRWLARRHRIPLGAVLSVGDQWNDFEMLVEAGHGAAMPTAPAEVRAAARYVAPPLEEEGVAQLIEDLVLARPSAALATSQRLAEAAVAMRDAATEGVVRRADPGTGKAVTATTR